MDTIISRPGETEYLPYYGKYISLVPDGDLFITLNKQLEETLSLLQTIPESQEGLRYAPDKWTVKELIGHVIDTERIFAYRALCFARNDKTPLPGFSENDYVNNASFNNNSLSELAAEFEFVRQSNLLLFRHFSEEAWMRKGMASDAEVSVRALAYIIAGHELHHRNILIDRYLQ